MSIEHESETWFFYGICDLYFSFHSDEWVFDYHSAFFAIMALEKHLKAYLIYSRKNEFKSLNEKQEMDKALEIARSYSHNFVKMTEEVENLIPNNAFTKLLDKNHDGYNGRELVKVLQKAYMETRYPTNQNVSLSFPVGDPGMYHNPLVSSGLHHFIQSCCICLVSNLETFIDMHKLLDNVQRQYKHLEPFNRFKNIYLQGNWPDAL